MFKLPSSELKPSELQLDKLEQSNEKNSQELTIKSKHSLLSKLSKSTENDDFTEMNEFDAVTDDINREEK